MKIADLLRTAHFGLVLYLMVYSILVAFGCQVSRDVEESGDAVEESGDCGEECHSIFI